MHTSSAWCIPVCDHTHECSDGKTDTVDVVGQADPLAAGHGHELLVGHALPLP